MSETRSLVKRSVIRANDPDSVMVTVIKVDVRYGQRVYREGGSTGLLGGIAGACFFGPIGALAGWGLTSSGGSTDVRTVPVRANVRFGNSDGQWIGYSVTQIGDDWITWYSSLRKGDRFRIGRLRPYFDGIEKLAEREISG